MQLYALRARTRRLDVDLTHPNQAPAIWQALRRRYPAALGGSIHPSKIELLVMAASSGEAQRGLADCLERLSREGPFRRHAFTPVPEVRPVVSRGAALRRALVELWGAPLSAAPGTAAHQPLWCTFRDLLAASANPWVSISALARWLELPSSDLPGLAWSWTHARAPAPAPPSPAQARALLRRRGVSTVELMLAAAAATRSAPLAVRDQTATRRVFVWTARELGAAAPEELADLCGTDRATIDRIARVVEGRSLDAGLVCAADPRLTLAIRQAASRVASTAPGLPTAGMARHSKASA